MTHALQNITVRDGLGGRVASIANALSAGRRLAFGWAVNVHCPLTHREVFPHGIPGVIFRDPHGDCGFTPWNGQPYFAWDGAACRPTANQAYGRIMDAMAGTAWESFPLGVCARFFRRPQTTPAALACFIRDTASRLGIGRVFLLADSHRAEIAALCPDLEIRFPHCPELAHDLHRSPEATRTFIDDWKTLLACPHIVAPDGPTTMLHPARAAGRPIHYPNG